MITRNLISKIAITATLILTLASTAFAGATVGLDEAIRTALRNNPLVMAKDSAKLAAAEAVGSARSHYFPKVVIEERYMRTDNPTYAFSTKLAQERFTMSDFDIDNLNDPEAIGDYQTSVSFEQLLYSRKASVGLKMAKVEAQSSALDFRRTKEKTVLNVYKAYFNVLTAKEYVKATAKGLEDAIENHRVSKLRFDSGLGLYTDTLSADVYLKETQERQLVSEKNLSLARLVLGLSMGLNDSIDAEDMELSFELDDFDQYALASRSRSDIRAMEHRVENARNNVQLAGSDYLPVVGIGGSYQVNSHSAPFEEEGASYQVMAFMRWNIFDGGLRKHNKAKAHQKFSEATHYLRGLKMETNLRVHEAYLSYHKSTSSLELAQARAAMAKENMSLIASRYENSLATILELLDAQSALDSARAGLAEKLNNHYIAAAELRFQSGTILNGLQEAN